MRDEDSRVLEIERLDTHATDNFHIGWQLIQLKSNLLQATGNMAVVSLNSHNSNKHRFLLFGGCSQKTIAQK